MRIFGFGVCLVEEKHIFNIYESRAFHIQRNIRFNKPVTLASSHKPRPSVWGLSKERKSMPRSRACFEWSFQLTSKGPILMLSRSSELRSAMLGKIPQMKLMSQKLS